MTRIDAIIRTHRLTSKSIRALVPGLNAAQASGIVGRVIENFSPEKLESIERSLLSALATDSFRVAA